MRWDDFRRSDNVEDDRGRSSPGGGVPGGASGLGIGTIIVIGLISWYFGIDPTVLINGAQILSGGGTQTEQTAPAPQGANARRGPDDDFVAAVLGDTEDRWKEIFAARGLTYEPVRVHLYAGSLPTECDTAHSAMGPFYCPLDKGIYLDTSFFDDLRAKFGACSSSSACRFSEAYVVAHEVGHHVQDLFGTLPKVMKAQQAASSRAEVNALQVRVELQADCYAGIWANHAQDKHKFLDPGDVDQALQTASAIGDDRLEKEFQGKVVPDSFTHGTSEQRKRWFMNGFNSGQTSACDTFRASTL
jgi:predicted metalloprotease